MRKPALVLLGAGSLLFLLACLLVLGGRAMPAAAQDTPNYWVHPDYTVRQWTIRDGLPASTLIDLLQTRDGYLWASSNEGLARFDGQRFTLFNIGSSPALPSNRVVDLAEGAPGQLWARTGPEGLGFIQQGQYSMVVPRDGQPASVLYVEGDTLWIGNPQGLFRYAAGHLEPFRPEVIDMRVSAVIRDGQGRLWVGLHQGGIYRFDADGTVRLFTEQDGVPALQVTTFLIDREGSLWAGLRGGLVRILGDRVITPRHPNDSWHQVIRMGVEDASGGVWFEHSTEGWWRHDPSGELNLYPAHRSTRINRGLKIGPEGQLWRAEDDRLYRGDVLVFQSESAIRVFTVNSQGHAWIGIGRAGLLRLSRSALRTISTPEGLPHRNVYPVLEDRNGAIWTGTDGGLARLEDDRVTQVIRPGEPVRVLYEDAKDRLWVFSGGEVCRVEGDRCVDLAIPFDGELRFSMRAMHEDRRGRFWLGGTRGIMLGVPTGETYTWTVPASQRGASRSVPQVRTILETRNGALLFGTGQGGVLRYDEDGDFEALTTQHGLASNNIRDLHEDHEGFLWVAHEDRGLCRIDRQGRLELATADVACLSTGQGLYWSGLHRILEDDYGRFWFNTNNGIFWVERTALMAYFAGEVSSVSSVSYTEADGMRNREGNGARSPAGVKARDGRLWFPTQDGVVVIDPKNLPLPTPPPVLLEAIQIGESIHPISDTLSLRPRERDVGIEYTALEFTRPEDVRFQYRLQGYDTDWRNAGTQRMARYTNLPAGAFTFEVRAGLGGRWGEPISLVLERGQYSWLSWWFLTLCGLIVLAGTYGLYRFRLRQVEARNYDLEQIVEARTEELRHANELKSRFLANISHEFRTPLTLTFGPLDDLANRRFDSLDQALPHINRARRNGSRLLRLINQLLDLSKLDAGALLLRLKRQDLAQHLRQLAALFDSIAETQGIDYSKRIASEPHWHVYDRDKLEKVVINLLSNAFKFTPQGRKVGIVLERAEGDAARIIVADAGSGIPEEALPHLFDRFYQVEGTSTRSHEGSGIGLALVKELVELHEGTIEVESQVGFGTRFTVLLPPLDHDEANETEPIEADKALHIGADEGVRIEADEAASEAAPWEAAPDEAERLDHTISGSLRIAPIPTPEQSQALPEDATVVLIVEDNTDMRQYIRAHLQDHFAILEAPNGRLGLEQARETVPDLVLSDVMMPEMDGLDLCAALKKEAATSHIPVVLLTAKAQVEHRIAGFESGADAYLPKPFNAEELIVRVRTLIAERERLRARIIDAARATRDPVDATGAEDAVTAPDGIEDPSPEPAPTETTLPPREAAFLEQIHSLIDEHLDQAAFGVDELADAVAMSPRQLLRKLRALTGETTAALIRRKRLEEAARLLGTGQVSVKEVAFTVGFELESSFSRAFTQRYGVPPSVYAEEAQQTQ